MQAWTIPAFGIENLALTDHRTPQPGPGQVLVEVKAASLNYRDLMVTLGLYNPKMHLPRIPASDGAGIVAAVGEGVTRVQPGDRVCGIFMQNWLDGRPTPEKVRGALGGDIDGMLATHVLLNAEGVVHFPEYLSFEEAATLPCAALTAWNALVTAGHLTAGETVLIQGTGGVSIFALQLAKAMGARVIGTSGSDEKLARAQTLGLDAGVNYRTTPDWAKWVLEQTGGPGGRCGGGSGRCGHLCTIADGCAHGRHSRADWRPQPVEGTRAYSGHPAQAGSFAGHLRGLAREF